MRPGRWLIAKSAAGVVTAAERQPDLWHLGSGEDLVERLLGHLDDTEPARHPVTVPTELALAARLVLFVGRIFAAFGSGPGALAALLLALMLLAMFAFLSFWLILIPLTAPLLAWAHRLGEFRADRVAASLGYAPPLIEVLHIWMAMADHEARPSGVRARLLASHPSHGDRIRRLEELAR